MFEFKLNFGGIEEGLTGPASFNNGQDIESDEDQAQIIGDQDETGTGLLNAGDEALGGMGSGEYGLKASSFASGEIDVVEQMARTTRAADKAAHRTDDVFPGFDTATEMDQTDAIADGMSTRTESDDATTAHPARGGETGAFTDLGARKSGVTREH